MAVADGRAVVLEGTLHNAAALAARLEFEDFAGDDAALVLRAYERLGADFLAALRGIFALVLWDAPRDTLLVARDQTGMHPCFYATAGAHFLVSSSAETLLRHPGVSPEVNRAALFDYIVDSWPSLRETFYARVNRVPPGSVLRWRGTDEAIYRYWDPRPVRSDSDWNDESQAHHFEELLEAAVARYVERSPAGIFLSGGLDSVSVAAFAADLARQQGKPAPWALSMAFRNSEANEEERQRAVAQQLGLPQEFLGFQDSPTGFLRPTLELSGQMEFPLLNMWLARYSQLAEIGRQHGCRIVLTGTGGDEWLGITPMLAADLIRSGDFAGLYRLWSITQRSFERTPLNQVWILGWRCGLRAILRDVTISGLERLSPAALAAIRRRRLFAAMPAWLMPDDALRKQVGDRIEHNETSRTQDPGPFGIYFSEARLALDHPIISWELEETFENGRRMGMRFLHPYWDPDLIEMLWRMPPSLLARGGRMKGLVREVVARRFPDLGFERQKKVEVKGLFFSILAKEAPAMWREMGGAKALSALGLAEHSRLDSEFFAALSAGSGSYQRACRLFDIMNMETWLRKRL